MCLEQHINFCIDIGGNSLDLVITESVGGVKVLLCEPGVFIIHPQAKFGVYGNHPVCPSVRVSVQNSCSVHIFLMEKQCSYFTKILFMT